MAIIENPKTIDLSDIQGMVTRGYAKLFKTAYMWLKVDDATKAKAWLKEIHPLIGCADHTKRWDKTLHLAFGAKGLEALGLDHKNMETFPNAFREGISTPHRSRILGDHGENSPEKWQWGGNDEHILLIFHTIDEAAMDVFISEQRSGIQQSGGFTIQKEMLAYQPKGGKEPFGFTDGISQPVIKGSGKKGPDIDIVETGEFLLGYKNEYGLYPDSPSLKVEQGDLSLLEDAPDGSGNKDLGKNGTFMVFRQIEQHVEKFWESMDAHTKNPDGSTNEAAKIRLASKCVGRWPSGASLAQFPDEDPGKGNANDDFGYADEDPDGLKCPFGSHLRRNNPRDAFRYYDKKQSLKISRRHRIIRRGKTYEVKGNTPEENEIGLQFICFNANLEMQFEFIQHAWANDSQSSGYSNDLDIIIGVAPEGNPAGETGQFTIQNEPVNEFFDNWERFVTIKGGAYYFFPSMTFIKYLSTL